MNIQHLIEEHSHTFIETFPSRDEKNYYYICPYCGEINLHLEAAGKNFLILPVSCFLLRQQVMTLPYNKKLASALLKIPVEFCQAPLHFQYRVHFPIQLKESVELD